jgi:hypothetical protein
MRDILRRQVSVLTAVACMIIGAWIINVPGPKNVTAGLVIADLALITATGIVGVVLHEFAHALVVILVGGKLVGIEIFAPPARVTFHLGAVPVAVGLSSGGMVKHQPLSALRDAAVTAAGPLANLLSAPLLLLLPLPRYFTDYMVLLALVTGLANLAPGGDGDDGTRLLQLRARLRTEADVRNLLAAVDWSRRPDAADRLINGYVMDVPEAIDCVAALASQPEMLQRISRLPWTLSDRPPRDAVRVVHRLSYKLLMIAGLPADLADLAATRVEWVLRQVDKSSEQPPVARPEARHALAVARLRQGRPADVRRLSADALASDLTPSDRATVLATIAMAKHALLLSGQVPLDEAVELDQDADLVGEAVIALATSPIGPVAAKAG